MRLSQVFRQPVTVVAVRAISPAGESGRVAGGWLVGGWLVGLGAGSGGRCAGWLGGVCWVGGVIGCGACCWAARPAPEMATTLQATRMRDFMTRTSMDTAGHVQWCGGVRA